MTKVNYTDEATELLKSLYAELGNDGLDAIAAQFPGKTKNSVRAKLVKEGVYVVPEKKVSSKKKEGPSKKDLIATLSKLTGSQHKGIDGATKDAISEIIGLFEVNQADQVESEVTA